MTRKYANPPVIEALCEFRMPPDVKWDLTIPGFIYEKIKKDFPDKEQRLIQEIEIVQEAQGLQQKIQTSERVFFFNSNKKIFIQVGAHLLAVNCLSPYPTWENFVPYIQNAHSAVVGMVSIDKLQKISLRYINRIEVPGDSLNLDDYFDFRPFLGKNLTQDMANFIVGCILPFHDRRDACKITFSNANSEQPGHQNFILDLDYFLAQPQTIAASGALEWVQQAHTNLNEVFEGCITDPLRKIFEEKN